MLLGSEGRPSREISYSKAGHSPSATSRKEPSSCSAKDWILEFRGSCHCCTIQVTIYRIRSLWCLSSASILASFPETFRGLNWALNCSVLKTRFREYRENRNR